MSQWVHSLLVKTDGLSEAKTYIKMLTLFRIFYRGCAVPNIVFKNPNNKIKVFDICANGKVGNSKYSSKDTELVECDDEYSKTYNIFLNEMTVFKYVYENIDSLLQTDYIGFISYRMSFPKIYVLRENAINVIMENMQCSVFEQYCCWHEENLIMRFLEQNLKNNSNFNDVLEYFNGRKMILQNTFICHKNVFCEMVEYILPLIDWCIEDMKLSGFMDSDIKVEREVRKYAYMMERIVGMWFWMQQPKNDIFNLDIDRYNIKPLWGKTLENNIK